MTCQQIFAVTNGLPPFSIVSTTLQQNRFTLCDTASHISLFKRHLDHHPNSYARLSCKSTDIIRVITQPCRQQCYDAPFVLCLNTKYSSLSPQFPDNVSELLCHVLQKQPPRAPLPQRHADLAPVPPQPCLKHSSEPSSAGSLRVQQAQSRRQKVFKNYNQLYL